MEHNWTNVFWGENKNGKYMQRKKSLGQHHHHEPMTDVLWTTHVSKRVYTAEENEKKERKEKKRNQERGKGCTARPVTGPHHNPDTHSCSAVLSREHSRRY